MVNRMRDKIFEAIAEQLNIDADKLSEETSFKDDLGADSLDLFEMLMAVENEFGITFDDSELESIQTIGDVIDRLKKAGI